MLHAKIDAMKIEISKLIPHPRNKQLYGEPQVDDLLESLEKFGLLQPVRINKYNMIISGHRRVAAAIKLGWKYIDVVKDEKTIDALEEIKELIISNQYRSKSIETRLREGMELEKIESQISFERRCRNGIPALGTTRDIIGEKIGLSGRGYIYGREVIREIDILKSQGRMGEAVKLKKLLNKSIRGALKKVNHSRIDSKYWYYRSLSKLIQSSKNAYLNMSKKRDENTPNNLWDMIGNIKDFIIMLESWLPKKISNCSFCEGTSVHPLTKDKCEYCINGQSGNSKESEY